MGPATVGRAIEGGVNLAQGSLASVRNRVTAAVPLRDEPQILLHR
jgi:hypothetical protein